MELVSFVPVPPKFLHSKNLCHTSHPYQITVPKCRTELFWSPFLSLAAEIYNSFPPSICPFSYNLSSFKSRVNSLELSQDYRCSSVFHILYSFPFARTGDPLMWSSPRLLCVTTTCEIKKISRPDLRLHDIVSPVYSFILKSHGCGKTSDAV